MQNRLSVHTLGTAIPLFTLQDKNQAAITKQTAIIAAIAVLGRSTALSMAGDSLPVVGRQE